DLLDELAPAQRAAQRKSYRELICHVEDRPGHDRRYALDAARMHDELGWTARFTLDEGLRDTVHWYLENTGWWQPLLDNHYRPERIGLAFVGARQRESRPERDERHCTRRRQRLAPAPHHAGGVQATTAHL